MFHQPRRRNFSSRLQCRVTWDSQVLSRSPSLYLCKLLGTQYRILEKRSCAATIFIPGDEQHPFTCPDFPYCFSHLRKRRRLGPPREMLFQVAVSNPRTAIMLQRVAHFYDDIFSALFGVKDAAPICKLAICFVEFS